MPKKKKPVKDMTTDEIADLVFGKKVKKQLQELASKPQGNK